MVSRKLALKGLESEPLSALRARTEIAEAESGLHPFVVSESLPFVVSPSNHGPSLIVCR